MIIVLYLLFGTVYGVIFWGWIRACNQVHGEYAAIKSGNIVEAVMIDTSIHSHYDENPAFETSSYDIIYEYIDGDVKYRGIAFNVEEYYEAEKYLGKTIKIYIDGKGGSLPVGRKPQITTLVIFTVFVVALFYPMLFWYHLMLVIIKWEEKRDEKKKLKDKSKSESFIYIRPNDSDNQHE